jgi:hypothetical protein
LVVALVVLPAAVLLLTALAGGKDKKSDAPQNTGVMLSTISFETLREDEWPELDLGSIGFRNPRALRPLYLAGRGYGGTISVHFDPDAEKLGDFTGEKKLGKLLSAAKTTGELKVICDEYSLSDAGHEQFAARELIAATPRPLVAVEVKNIRQWVPMSRQRTSAGVRTRYQAVCDGSVALVRREWSGEGLDRTKTDEVLKTARFEGAKVEILFKDITVPYGRSTLTLGAMIVRGTADITGSDLGLTGRDAGEMEIRFSVEGMTDFGKSSTEAMDLDKATEQ